MAAVSHWTHIVLIGMPGSGKSTLGVLLAKRLGMRFVDTDLEIQARQGRRLQEIIDRDGLEAMRRLERQVLLELSPAGCVVATGGSAIYYEDAMVHLADGGCVVYLRASLATLVSRIGDMNSRGMVIQPGMTFEQLFAQRQPLYEKYAQATLDCDAAGHEELLAALVRLVEGP